MHLNIKGEVIPVLVRQSKNYFSYKLRKPKKNEDFSQPTAMDNDFFNTSEGLGSD